MARRSVGNRSFRLRPFEWTLSLSLGDVCGGTRLSSLGSRSFIHSLSGDGDVRLSLSLLCLFCSVCLFTCAHLLLLMNSVPSPSPSSPQFLLQTVFLPVHVSLTVSVFRFTERTAVLCCALCLPIDWFVVWTVWSVPNLTVRFYFEFSLYADHRRSQVLPVLQVFCFYFWINSSSPTELLNLLHLLGKF